jgi:glycosyltransferase involved in cell wall biosynthesis
VNKSVIQEYIGPSASANAFAVPATRVDLVQSLLPESGSRSMRIALLIKSMRRSGGNRVIAGLFDRLRRLDNIEIHVFVVPESSPHLGEVRNLFMAKRKYRAAASVTRPGRAVDPGEYDLLISTSRRTLDFVTDPAHPRHVHLLQAIEAWDTVNSPFFLDYCMERRYPSPEDCIDLIREIGLPQDVRYLHQIGLVDRIRTVSGYLDSAIRYAGRPSEVVVCEPELFLRGTGGRATRDIDILLFLRGEPYNGDVLSVAITNTFQEPCHMMVVATRKATPLLKKIRRRDQTSVIFDPLDGALKEIFASTRFVLHPSLCNGGGFIPIEALSFGCNVVSSRTGWLSTAKSTGNLIIVDRHDPSLYRSALEGCLRCEK